MSEFRRETRVRLPFECLDADPKKNYGHGGLQTWHVLIGPKAAVQFVVYWPYYLPRTRAIWDRDGVDRSTWRDNSPSGAGVDYHAFEPQYEGQPVQDPACTFLGGKPCYFDGSGLRAQEWCEEIFSDHGFPEEKIWTRLENEYRTRFEEAKDE